MIDVDDDDKEESIAHFKSGIDMQRPSERCAFLLGSPRQQAL